MTRPPADLPGWSHGRMLDVLARADAAELKAFAETLIGSLGAINVRASRTGLVMLPMRDTAQGVNFHLGEVLVSEAHVEAEGQDGYGMRRGHDLEAAMAMALVDLAVARGVSASACAAFLARQMAAQQAEDRAVLARVEATRIEMETF